MRRIEVHDAVDGLNRVGRVQRGENEVAGLRGGDRRGGGFEIAHFSEEDHVGILPQDMSSALRKN